MKKILHIIEFIIIKIALIIFGCMSFSCASNIGGAIGKWIGPKLKVTNTARKNIKLAMPELSAARIEEIIIGMWDNLGRTVMEFPHLKKLQREDIEKIVEIEGWENVNSEVNSAGCFIMTGHIGNWEMVPRIAYHKNYPLHIVYRKANNPYVDKIIYNMRKEYQFSASAKSSIGARQIIKSLQNNRKIIMLVDQKQNDGISVPLFGVPAMTAPGIATMSLRYNANILPVRVIRKNNSNFRVIIYPAMQIKNTGDIDQDSKNLMVEINAILESWIREYPEQWFWVHNRWPKNAAQKN